MLYVLSGIYALGWTDETAIFRGQKLNFQTDITRTWFVNLSLTWDFKFQTTFNKRILNSEPPEKKKSVSHISQF